MISAELVEIVDAVEGVVVDDDVVAAEVVVAVVVVEAVFAQVVAVEKLLPTEAMLAFD
jgi:hypothetical protein